MFKTLKKLFDNEYKELYRFSKLADQIDALDEEMSKLSDKKLASYTDKFKKRLEWFGYQLSVNGCQLNQREHRERTNF